MISEGEAGKIFDKLINRDECIKRIMDIDPKLHSHFPVLYSEISRDAFISYVFGSFSGSIILSAVLLETALEEALMEKKDYSKTKIKNLKLGQLIDKAYREGLISEESKEIADYINECRNNLAHSDTKDADKRVKAGSDPTEDWIQSIDRDKKSNEDTAKSIINNTKKILLEIYSNQR